MKPGTGYFQAVVVRVVAVLFLLVWVPAAGCGPREAPRGVEVELVAPAVDGETPAEGWRLRASDGRDVALRDTGRRGERGGRLVGANAAAQRYGLLGPQGWGAVGGPTLAAMAPGTATAIGVGQDHTVYLLPPPARVVREVVVVDAGPGAGGEAVSFRREDGSDGRVALRIKPDAWRGTFLVRASLAASEAPATAPPSAFARFDRVTPPASGTCTGIGLVEGAILPVRIAVAPVSARRMLRLVAEQEGLSVTRDLPLDAQGVADAAGVPATEGRLEFAWADADASSPRWILPGPLAVKGDLRLLAGDGTTSMRVRLEGGTLPTDGALVAARTIGMTAYGVVPGVVRAADGQSFTVPLPPGAWHFLVTTPSAVGLASSSPETPGTPGAETVVVLERPCRVHAGVEGGVPKGRRFELECIREELDGDTAVEVTAQGWYERLVSRADLELLLPVGRYRIRLREGGRFAPWTSLHLDRPATRVALRLPPPR